jgi:hypothetical protein
MLTGCAEPLQTGRPPTLEPSPSLPGPDMISPATSMSPTPEIADVTPSVTELPATSPPSPASESPTIPLTETAELAPTAGPEPELTIVPPTLPRLTNEERWRAQQANREVFAAPQAYTTSGSRLWWYDPINQQHVVLGNFSGPFVAQARFQLVGQGGVAALEVPYQINESYGLTALSPALVQRLRDAGYEDWVETYVILSPDVQPVDAQE